MLEYWELLDLLKREDEVTVLELLDLTSEDLVEAFRGRIKQRRAYIQKYLDGDMDESEEVFGQGVHIGYPE